ncbi:murein hydrolase activator EnvC family protein [Caloramator proteoclasticus]|uniref:Septal ring factor EnvC, activator of murein hydrolases AmiA and AmiB n=1 Tax=Caloramator proteoclasticus DSM 10124 TaxID=1121262 RepID=A0A1M4WMV5_9CLOT|nr:M23 family metallopeptidase [Caloramator proteoclasticus]SHE82556.1 Septal ring factor EnvC, activator of murein hydrolases AmiA and AmiB [Caloramator proteoclasticus DSM 10124]
MKKRIAVVFMTLMFTFSSSFVLADELKEKQKQLNETKKNIENLKGKIDDVKDKQEDVEKEINNLNSKIDKLQNSIENLDNQIADTKMRIKQLNKEIKQLEKEYEEQQELYKERIKVMYMNGPSSILEVLLDSQNFSDFFGRAEIVKAIVENDKNILKCIAEKKEQIENKAKEVTQKQQRLLSMQYELSSQKSQLDEACREQRRLYDKLENDKAYLERVLKAEQEESNLLEKQIKEIQARQKKNNNFGTFSKTGIIKVSDLGYIPKVTSPFGMRMHPVLGYARMHNGMDIAVPTGTPIYSMAKGEVIIAQYMKSYGNVVIIDHGDGLTSTYAHLSKISVSVGQVVEKGQMIGKSGNTGLSSGPHLHFEIRKNGVPVDPTPYYIVGQ